MTARQEMDVLVQSVAEILTDLTEQYGMDKQITAVTFVRRLLRRLSNENT